jgi:hypothetical protein
VRLDPQTTQVQAQIAISPAPCAGVVALAQTIWVLSFFSGNGSSVQLERIDPATNTISATIHVPAYPPVAADERGVWFWNPDQGLFRVDPSTNTVVGKLAITGGAGVGIGAGSVWFAKSDGTLLRITPAA